MALRITSIRPRFFVTAGMQLQEMPRVRDWNEDVEKASLMENWQLQIPSQMPPLKCPKLTTLLLSKCYIESIPECFFEQMHGLKILDLSYNPIRSLPDTISNLKSLTTLLLHSCRRLEKVPSFSKLEALKKLNLGSTNIKDIPHGMERLMKGEEIGGLRKLEFFEAGIYDLNKLNSYIQKNASTLVSRKNASRCDEIEEIFASEAELEEEGIASKFTLPNLCWFELCNLPELKSVCGANGVMVSDSLNHIDIINCPKLRRISLNLPLQDDGQPSPPPSLRTITISSKQWWELLCGTIQMPSLC
ncbi:hypothetical protein PTKIN_Ptkin14bG0113200 [Pterospermum kingtungense]